MLEVLGVRGWSGISLSVSFFFQIILCREVGTELGGRGGDIAYFFPSHGVFEEGEMRQSLEVP